jgi:hypothetical protein
MPPRELGARLAAAIETEAIHYGLTPDEVIRLAIEAGLPHIGKRAARLQEDKARKAELENLLQTHSYAELGAKLGYTRQNIRAMCVRLGVQNPRGPGRPRKAA